MSPSKLTRAYGRGCLRTAIAAPLGLMLGLILVSFAVFVANRTRPEQEAYAMAVVGCFYLFLLAVIAAAAIGFVVWRGRWLDAALGSEIGSGRQVGARARTWTGTVDGREFQAWVARGPRLEIYIECDVGTRAAIRRVGPVVRALSDQFFRQGEPVEPPAELSDCEVLSHDPNWMVRFLRRPGVGSTAAELMTPSERVAPGLLFTPGAIAYLWQFTPLAEINQSNLTRWTTALARLARTVDRVGPSSDNLEEGRLETWARTSRRLPINPVWLILGCGFLSVTALVVAVVVLVAVAGRS